MPQFISKKCRHRMKVADVAAQEYTADATLYCPSCEEFHGFEKGGET